MYIGTATVQGKISYFASFGYGKEGVQSNFLEIQNNVQVS